MYVVGYLRPKGSSLGKSVGPCFTRMSKNYMAVESFFYAIYASQSHYKVLTNNEL